MGVLGRANQIKFLAGLALRHDRDLLVMTRYLRYSYDSKTNRLAVLFHDHEESQNRVHDPCWKELLLNLGQKTVLHDHDLCLFLWECLLQIYLLQTR
jgi:hypothetical protein